MLTPAPHPNPRPAAPHAAMASHEFMAAIRHFNACGTPTQQTTANGIPYLINAFLDRRPTPGPQHPRSQLPRLLQAPAPRVLHQPPDNPR